VINNTVTDDDDDIDPEIRKMLMRTNVPMRCFGKCSVSVNWTLFNAVVTSEIKLKQNNFTETQNIVCFVSVLFQFYFSYNHGLSVTV